MHTSIGLGSIAAALRGGSRRFFGAFVFRNSGYRSLIGLLCTEAFHQEYCAVRVWGPEKEGGILWNAMDQVFQLREVAQRLEVYRGSGRVGVRGFSVSSQHLRPRTFLCMSHVDTMVSDFPIVACTTWTRAPTKPRPNSKHLPPTIRGVDMCFVLSSRPSWGERIALTVHHRDLDP